MRMSLAASKMSISPLAAQWPYLPQPMHEELAQAPSCTGNALHWDQAKQGSGAEAGRGKPLAGARQP